MARTKFTTLGPRSPKPDSATKESGQSTAEKEAVLPSIEGKDGAAPQNPSDADKQASSASASETDEETVPSKNKPREPYEVPPLSPFEDRRNGFLENYGRRPVITFESRLHFGKKPPPKDVPVRIKADAAKDALLYLEGQRRDRDHYESIYRFTPEEVLDFDYGRTTELVEAIDRLADLGNRRKGADPEVERTWALYHEQVLNHKAGDRYRVARFDETSEISKAFDAFMEVCDEFYDDSIDGGFTTSNEESDEDCDLDYDDEDEDDDMDYDGDCDEDYNKDHDKK